MWALCPTSWEGRLSVIIQRQELPFMRTSHRIASTWTYSIQLKGEWKAHKTFTAFMRYNWVNIFGHLFLKSNKLYSFSLNAKSQWQILIFLFWKRIIIYVFWKVMGAWKIFFVYIRKIFKVLNKLHCKTGTVRIKMYIALYKSKDFLFYCSVKAVSVWLLLLLPHLIMIENFLFPLSLMT